MQALWRVRGSQVVLGKLPRWTTKLIVSLPMKSILTAAAETEFSVEFSRLKSERLGRPQTLVFDYTVFVDPI